MKLLELDYFNWVY